jgi:hypothetical protein
MLSLMDPLVLCRRKNFWTEVDFYSVYCNCSRGPNDGAGSGVYACQCLGAIWETQIPKPPTRSKICQSAVINDSFRASSFGSYHGSDRAPCLARCGGCVFDLVTAGQWKCSCPALLPLNLFQQLEHYIHQAKEHCSGYKLSAPALDHLISGLDHARTNPYCVEGRLEAGSSRATVFTREYFGGSLLSPYADHCNRIDGIQIVCWGSPHMTEYN